MSGAGRLSFKEEFDRKTNSSETTRKTLTKINLTKNQLLRKKTKSCNIYVDKSTMHVFLYDGSCCQKNFERMSVIRVKLSMPEVYLLR